MMNLRFRGPIVLGLVLFLSLMVGCASSGKKKGGATAAEVAKEIFAALYDKIQSPAVVGALNDQLKKLSGVGIDEIGKAAKGAAGIAEGAAKEAGSVTDKVKGLFEKKD